MTQDSYDFLMTDLLNANTYLISKKLLKILGEEFYIYTDDNKDVLIGYSEQKALKIKEDIRVFSDKSKSNKILNIKQRNVIDTLGRFDFTDPNTGGSLGGIRRNWGKSWLRDSYSIYGPDDQAYGEVKEDSLMKAMLRRWVPFLGGLFWFPKFWMNVQGQPSITFQTSKEWLGFGRGTLEVHIPDENQLDRRVILGAAMIIIAIEGEQNEAGWHDLMPN